ncbi:hypothetical protein DVA67_012590 [Solirubrobacter sp. CPCC 204708]|uniref:Ig-like domain-containing protein n=1 Tax=Solirubrobacter deserti TaxID=2282478 RepID=A0ABT4RL09_9ACTN|nr:Ig-like domain-containing protein [Solirubrobacter deserti]MBE2316813.1 hypothetical protein [Solirubrobacter deserti]MDA0138970.1 Ig-like domain-containing protein [Solirubrobacter deserti]
MGWRAAFITSIATLLCAAPAQAATYTVTGTGDPGGACSGTTCTTLRAAIEAAERAPGADTIELPAGTITIAADYTVGTQLTITGASARTTVIDGGDKHRPFRVGANGQLALSNVWLRNGLSGGGDVTDGGALYVNQGFVTLQDVRISSSTASRGGGIANNLGRVVGDNVLIDNNASTGLGGAGIHNVGGSELANQDGWIALTDTTIFNNTASSASGVGGLLSTGSGALVTLTRSTIADNDGGSRSVGGIVPSGATGATGSIIARNLADGTTVNCSAPLTDGNFNVEDDTDCGLAPGKLTPGLANALSNQGGQIDVLPITTAGAAFNRMPLGDTPCEGTDQRGLSRPQGTACDAGAFEVDQAATVTITGGPSGTVTATNVQFDFRANEPGVTVQCDLTGPGQTASWETCYKENAQPYASLADGPYTFSVRAVSAAFPNPPVAMRTFVVNAAGAPTTTLTGGPDGPTNDATPTFTFSSNEAGSTFECAVDSDAFATCTSPHTTAPLAEGGRTFRVRARDAAGVVGNTVTRAFSVDRTAPDTTIGSGPSGPVASTSAAFTYTSEPGATFQCSLDGAAFGACPVNYTGLAQGPHTFQVRAHDAAGNFDASPATRAWTVDTVRPSPPAVAYPAQNQWVRTRSVTVSGTAEAGASIEIREGQFFRGTATVTGAGTWSIPLAVVTDDTHVYSVTARDGAGNTSDPTVRTFRVDTVAPAAPTMAEAVVNGATVTLSGRSEAGATVELFDGATALATTTADANAAWTHTLTGVANGTHSYTARARDAAGNESGGSTPPRIATVNTGSPPELELTGPSGATDANPVFAFTASEPTTECRLDGPDGPGAYAACVSPKTFNALAPGGYVFFVRVTDAAGNRSESRREFTVAQPQAGPGPGPGTPTPTPAPAPTPVPNQTIVVAPAQGTVLVKPRGALSFAPLDVTTGIPNGSEVDVRAGRVTLTSIPRPGAPAETADFYGGIFIVTQKGGITELKLSERLTGCPRGQQARLAQSKPKKRRLWGDGKGAFRTSGKYSAATVRGTRWLVEDTCTTTFTRVAVGSVEVRDLVKKTRTVLRKGKTYTARAKRR